MKQIIFLLVLAMGLAWAGTARAGEFEDRVSALAAGGTKAKIAAIGELVRTGDARAAAILEAMLGGGLYTRKSDNSVVIAEKTGAVFALTDPFTGAEAGRAGKAEIKKIRVNNRLRRILRGALGGLTLLSTDPARRLAAAESVFKSRDPALAVILVQAVARETDGKIRYRMELALAAIRLTTASAKAAKLEAVKTLSGRASNDVRALLAESSAKETDPEVKAAVVAALQSVEQSLAFWNTVGDLFRGISLGSVLVLAAVGLAITFGVMGVINMAHGELIMIGAYTTYVVQDIIRAAAPGLFDWSLVIAVPAAFIVAGGTGVAIERGIIRFLYGRPLETLLATWGLSLILRQLVRTLFGPTNQEVGAPSWMSGALEVTAGLTLTYNRIWIIFFSLAVLALLWAVLNKTPFGLQMRAVTQNRRMAGSMGIRAGRIDALTFGLGSGVAGIAGVALSQIDNVSPNLGQAYIIDSFLVVVFGGVGSLWGTLLGGFGLGIVNKFLEPVSGAVLGKIIVLVVIILFIQVRPRGLFALKGRAAES